MMLFSYGGSSGTRRVRVRHSGSQCIIFIGVLDRGGSTSVRGISNHYKGETK